MKGFGREIETSPGWVRAAAVQPALRLGAELANLHQTLAISPITGMAADRCGLLAAAKALVRIGRPEDLAALRDMRMMGAPSGPAAPILSAWTWLGGLPWEASAAFRFRRHRDEGPAVETPADRRYHSRLYELLRSLGLRAPDLAEALTLAAGAAAAMPCPLAAAGAALEAGAGLPLHHQLLAVDYAVGRCLGWPLPLYSLGLGRRELPDPSPAALARVLLAGTGELGDLVRPLSTQAGDLVTAGSRVRTKQAGAVVARILASDSVWSSALVDLLPDRPARRLLQRLVELGALRELTGRPTYRLYGL